MRPTGVLCACQDQRYPRLQGRALVDSPILLRAGSSGIAPSKLMQHNLAVAEVGRRADDVRRALCAWASGRFTRRRRSRQTGTTSSAAWKTRRREAPAMSRACASSAKALALGQPHRTVRPAWSVTSGVLCRGQDLRRPPGALGSRRCDTWSSAIWACGLDHERHRTLLAHANGTRPIFLANLAARTSSAAIVAGPGN